MRIDAFVWPEDRVEHIARHGVTPEEGEEVCFGKPLGATREIRRRESGILCTGPIRSGSPLVLRGYPVSRRQWISRDRAGDDHQRETSIPKMERQMKKS